MSKMRLKKKDLKAFLEFCRSKGLKTIETSETKGIVSEVIFKRRSVAICDHPVYSKVLNSGVLLHPLVDEFYESQKVERPRPFKPGQINIFASGRNVGRNTHG